MFNSSSSPPFLLVSEQAGQIPTESSSAASALK